MKNKVLNIAGRILLALLGIALLGASMAVYIKNGVGSDSVSVFVEGGAKFTHLSDGTFTIVMYLLFMIIAFFIDKKSFGIASILVMFLTKFPVDFVESIYVAPSSFIVRCLIDVLMCASFGVACALIVKSNLGASPYDSLTLSVTKATKKKYTIIRYICDGVLLVTGWLMGGVIGVGTIIAFICCGPCFNFFLKLFKAN